MNDGDDYDHHGHDNQELWPVNDGKDYIEVVKNEDEKEKRMMIVVVVTMTIMAKMMKK